uniref:Uncharacterized protein n=1 Tax=Anguilla anguilla TaxID=7936 RepID=A0A0E9THN8_ANGAN
MIFVSLNQLPVATYRSLCGPWRCLGNLSFLHHSCLQTAPR